MIKSKKLWWALCIGTGLLAFVVLMSHTYNDIVVTTRHGINFWNILLNGDIFSFYNANVIASGNEFYGKVQGCAYNILVYIIFAIWNLPLYLLERFCNVDVMNNVICLAYSKLMLVAAVLVTAYILNKIMTAIGVPQEARKLLTYVYLSSSLIIEIICITSQYDIFSVIFQLLGFWAFIKKDDKKFILWFGVAFCFKFFSLFAFLPLLLMRRKRVLPILQSGVMMASPWLITRIPFWLKGVLGEYAVGQIAGGEKMAGSFIIGILGTATAADYANVFVLIYAALLVWCYLRPADSENSAVEATFACFVSYAAFFGTMDAYPYWAILLAPFVVLALALSPDHVYLNLILETVGLAGLVFKNMLSYPWCHFGQTLQPMIWPVLLKGTGFDTTFANSTLYGLFAKANRPPVLGFVVTFFMAGMALLAYITYSRGSASDLKRWKHAERCEDVLIVRFAINALLCLLPVIAVFF